MQIPSLSGTLISVLSQAADCLMRWETVELGQTSPWIPWKFSLMTEEKTKTGLGWKPLDLSIDRGSLQTTKMDVYLSPVTKWTTQCRHDRAERDCWLSYFVPFVLNSPYNAGLCSRKPRFLRLSTNFLLQIVTRPAESESVWCTSTPSVCHRKFTADTLLDCWNAPTTMREPKFHFASTTIAAQRERRQ